MTPVLRTCNSLIRLLAFGMLTFESWHLKL